MGDSEEMKPVRCGCGGKAEIRYQSDMYGVRCSKCFIWNGGFNTEAEAIEAWNKAMGAKDINVPVKERTAKVIPIETDNAAGMLWKCSECGQPMHRTSWSRQNNYCPSCGAKLDWSRNE